MATKNDFEEILNNVKSNIVDNLAAKLTAIETEKGDSIDLPDIDASAYFLQTLSDKAANYDPCLIYGIESIETEPNYGDTAEKISIFIVYLLADQNTDNTITILFRVQRALKEIFEENFTDYTIGNKILIRRLEPVPFESLDSSAKYKAIGIVLETYLA